MVRPSFKIKKKVIGTGRTFIIAEIGSNHNQNLQTAKQLIDIAADAGADAVKFQSLQFDKLYVHNLKNIQMKQLFKQIELRDEWHRELAEYCQRKNVFFFTAATYLEAVDLLEKVNVELYKIASPQTVTFPQLIEKIARLKKPIIMSTGYCTLKEIDRAVRIVHKNGNKKLALLHCISEYPTTPEGVNLTFIKTLKHIYRIPVGFSDHTLGWSVTLAAVAMGADIIEKHITLSKQHEGPDHHFSLEPNEFRQMVHDIRMIEKSIGDGKKEHITASELALLKKLKMNALANDNIHKDSILNKEKDIIFRRLNEGMDAWDVYNADSLRAKTDISICTPLTKTNIQVKQEKIMRKKS